MWSVEDGFVPEDYLDAVGPGVEVDAIRALRDERRGRLFAPRVQPYRDAVQQVSTLSSSWHALHEDVVRVGRSEELDEAEQGRWLRSLQAFCPWKKGPFSLFDVEIDAEWRSDWKWNRILPEIQPLKGRKVADIGCHNGYYMFRMLPQQPALVVGFEPYAKHFWNFQLVQNLLQAPSLAFELLGCEHIDLYKGFFDTIFCLGILYHHTDPVGLLRQMRQALAPGGEIVVDCQGIPGEQPLALTPRKRYANARGIWFLPTASCLEHWMWRAGFAKVRTFFSQPLSTQEQRPTPWANIQSLQDFLNPQDPSLTLEGYPAPWRHYTIAAKG